ncbi:MAG: site-specific integrase [Desulfobulbaceae bacterium]|nr:MAG: site-specific integrase [Desulfobulbaceae bacterium]
MNNTRHKTSYPGVFFRIRQRIGGTGTEKVYYAVFKRDGKVVETQVGRQYRDAMTPAKASTLRGQMIEGKEKTGAEKRAERAQYEERWTVRKIWNEYRKHLPGGEASKPDLSRWTLFLEKSFGSKEPAEIIKLDTDRLRIKLMKTKSPQTVKHILGLLRRILRFGADRGLCPPLSFSIGLPRVDNIKTEDLDTDQLQRLLAVLDTTHRTAAAAMMKIALFTGMRRGEIFKLKWEDLDFQRGFISIMEPKGGKSQKIPMNRAAREVFESVASNSEWVFPARNGGPRRDANKTFNAIKKEAGLPSDFRPMHGLRHLYATMLASSGQVDMFTLQKLMTHKSPAMTQRYIHFRDDALRAAAEKVDNIISEATKKQSKKEVV